MENIRDRELRNLQLLLGPERFQDESLRGGHKPKEVSSFNGSSPHQQHSVPGGKGDGERILEEKSAQRQSYSLQSPFDEPPSLNDMQSPETRPGSRVSKDFGRYTSPWSDSSEDSDQGVPTLSVGQQVEPGELFCPILAVSRYPYKYLNHRKDFMESVADACFNNGKFWDYKWTIFFLPLPDDVSGKPLFLVPQREVENLFSEIRQKLNTELEFPSGLHGSGFSVSFERNEPRPFYLGISKSRQGFNSIQDNIPLEVAKLSETIVNEGYKKSSTSFYKKVEAAVQAAKAGRAKSKRKSKIDRTNATELWQKQLHRAQSYLGLRPSPPEEDTENRKQPVENGYQAAETRPQTAKIEHPPELNADEAPCFPFWNDTVVVAIDVEANERSASMITEVGVATLDTRHISGIAPGPGAKNWRACAKYRHFRIDEYKTHRNSQFIQGCPDRFEKDFGDSEFVRKADIPRALALCCKPPFHRKISSLLGTDALGGSESEKSMKRNIVVVGHNVDSDIQYLRTIGFDLTHLSGLVDVLDTTMMHRAMARRTEPSSLAGVLQLLGISGWNLHNAGNDAAYTLQACMGMAVDYLSKSKYRDFEAESARRREEAIRLAEKSHEDDYHEWLGITKEAKE